MNFDINKGCVSIKFHKNEISSIRDFCIEKVTTCGCYLNYKSKPCKECAPYEAIGSKIWELGWEKYKADFYICAYDTKSKSCNLVKC